MSRDDLIGVNTGIIKTVGGAIKANCPNAFVIGHHQSARRHGLGDA